MARDRDEWLRRWPASPRPDDVFASDEVGVAGVMASVTDTSPHAAAPVGDRGGAVATQAPVLPGWSVDDDAPGSPAGSIRPPDAAPVEPAGPERPRGPLSLIAVALIASLFGGAIGTAVTLAATGDDAVATVDGTDPGPQVNAPTVDLGDFEGTNVVSAVAAAVTPSVVRIDILADGANGVAQEVGLGSGVIYRSDGYVITNNHVVESADNLVVKLADGQEFDAEIVGTDPLNDLAVLRIQATGLPAVNIREDAPIVGETAIAIGSPFGLDASVTAGVISAVGRDIQVPDGATVSVISAVIQTDAAINPGNSGGALVDAQGRLLGVNSAILTTTGGSQGVGFAIPVAQAVISAEQLIETGVVRHAFLGVSGDDVTREVADRFGLDEPKGALLGSIEPGTGAAEAGLQADDIIVEVEGDAIDSMTDLVVAVRQFQPGDTVEVVYLRDGQRRTTSVTLGERPGSS